MYHIKPFLKKRGYNLSAIATEVGMSFQRFSHHIKPKDDLSYNLVSELSKIVGISTDEFIEKVKVYRNVDEN